MLTSQVSQGASRVRIPPSPQVDADISGVTTTDAAWAAGFFDAEGSVVLRRQRKTWRRELEATQGGREVPPILERFRDALGRGVIHGPRRGYLYYWRASRLADIEAVYDLLGSLVSEPKSGQLATAAQRVGRPFQARAVFPSEEHELAWAAGFFGGDGTTSAGRANRLHPEYRQLRAGIPQAEFAGAVPPVLVRFQQAVGGIGSIHGPFMPRNPWSKRRQYTWQVTGISRTEVLLELIWPWLDDAKRQQARSAITAARRGGPHRPLPPPSSLFELS